MTEIGFEYRPENKGQEQWSTFVIKLSKEVTDDPEDDHDEHFENLISQAVRTYQAKEQDKGKKNAVRNLEDLHPEGYEGEIEY